MVDAEHEVLAFMGFAKAAPSPDPQHKSLKRLDAEVKRRTNVIGIFPNEQALIRLVGAMMLEQNTNGRYSAVICRLKIAVLERESVSTALRPIN